MIRAIYLGYRLLKEALHRTVGVDREASLPATAFVVVVLVNAADGIVAPVLRKLRARPPPPSFGDGVIALATTRYAVRTIGGEQLRTTPLATAIITGALVAPAIKLALLPVSLARVALSGALAAWRYVSGAPVRSGRRVSAASSFGQLTSDKDR